MFLINVKMCFKKVLLVYINPDIHNKIRRINPSKNFNFQNCLKSDKDRHIFLLYKLINTYIIPKEISD